MAIKNTIDEVIAATPNRRGLLRKLGIASAALAAGASLGSKKLRAQSSGPAPSAVVQFALNLEYLEAEFYSVATTGMTLEATGYAVSGSGASGPTMTSYGKVNFANSLVLTGSVAQDIAADEIAHVQVLRAALTATGSHRQTGHQSLCAGDDGSFARQ